MSRRFSFLAAAVVAMGTLAVIVFPADARPRGGGGRGGGRGAAGFRGGFGGRGFGGRGFAGRGFAGRGFAGRRFGVGRFGFGRFGVGGFGFGLGSGGFGSGGFGYVPYSPFGTDVPYDSYGTYVPYGVSVSEYSPSTTGVETPSGGTAASDTPAIPDATQPAAGTENSAQTANDNTAHLMFVVPADASIYVEGQKTNLTGTQREFVSPPLTPGKTFVYTVRVRYPKDGKKVDETRKVRVRAGNWWRVDFTKPAPTTIKVPAATEDK